MTTFYSPFYPEADGAKGSAAFLGAITTTIVYLYKRTTSILTDLDKPNGDSVYTFATADLNTSSITNGWSETIPSGDDPLWVVAATATGINPTDTIESNEWTSPVQLARNGTDGLNTATVYLYKRSNSATLPSVPSSTTTYSFTTGALSGTLDGWSQSAPDSVLGKYLFTTTATVISTSLTDDILSSEWSDVVILTVNGEDGQDGQDGETGLTAFLTNESHTLAANASGVVSSYAGASGTFYVYKVGAGDVSSYFTLSTLSNPQLLTISYPIGTRNYSVTGGLDSGEDQASITIRATGSGPYDGILIDKVFSLSKSKAGTDGTDGTDGSSAKLLSLTPSRQIINYSGGGGLNPASQTIDFTTTKQNTTATVSWTLKDTLGNTLNPATYLFTTSGNTNSMTANQFNAAIAVNNARGVIVTASLTDGITLSDSATIVKVVDGVDGVDGTDGTSAVVANLSNDNVTVPASSDGSSPVLTAAVTTLSVYEGGADVSSSWSVTATPSTGVTGTLSGKTYTVTGFTSDTGYVDFTATRSGYANQVVRFSLSKAKAGSNGSPATVYEVESLTGVIRKNAAGVYSPTAITFSAYSTTGTQVRASYAGRFIIATSTDGSSYTNTYTSSSNEGSYSYSIPASITHVRVRLYQAGGTSTLLDEEIIPVVSDGTNGTNGDPGVAGLSSYLSNDSSIVFTYADGTPVGFTGIDGYMYILSGNSSVTTDATNFSATASGCTGTINTADNNPVSGKPKGYYRVTAMSADTATLTLSASYGGYTFTKTFSLTKSKAGYDIVSSLPATNLFQGRTVFLTTDNKLYRYTGSAWTTAVPALDISGTITNAQIEGLAASKVTGQLTSSQIASIDAATKLTGLVPIANIPSIPTSQLSGTISATQIADNSITSAKIVANTITANDIAADTITSNEIAANAITSNELAANAVTAGKIAAGSITAADIAANTITASKIAAGTITATELAAGSITAAKIAAGTITATEIAADTITGDKIAANSITASELAVNAVTADKISAGSITAAKLAAGEIISSSAQIANGIITNAKIGNLEVSSAKIADLTVGTQKIEELAVTKLTYVQTASQVTVPVQQTVNIASISFNKTRSDSVLKFEASLKFNATTGDEDLRGTIYINGGSATTQLTFVGYGAGRYDASGNYLGECYYDYYSYSCPGDYEYQSLGTVSFSWPLLVNGAGGDDLNIPLSFIGYALNQPVGLSNYTISFYCSGGTNAVNIFAGSSLAVREEKR